MKNLFYFLLFIFSAVLLSCSNDDDDDDVIIRNNTTTSELESIKTLYKGQRYIIFDNGSLSFLDKSPNAKKDFAHFSYRIEGEKLYISQGKDYEASGSIHYMKRKNDSDWLHIHNDIRDSSDNLPSYICEYWIVP